MTHADDSFAHTPVRSTNGEAVRVDRAVLFLRGRGGCAVKNPRLRDILDTEAGVFEPDVVSILADAFDEACTFCKQAGVVGPARRRQLAGIIVYHAKRGLRDSHRLALKAIIA